MEVIYIKADVNDINDSIDLKIKQNTKISMREKIVIFNKI